MRDEQTDGETARAAAKVFFAKEGARPKQNKGTEGEEVIDKRDTAANKNHSQTAADWRWGRQRLRKWC